MAHAKPGLSSWAKFSRPYGTRFRDGRSHAGAKSPHSRRILWHGTAEAVPFVKSRAHGLESFPLLGGPQEARHALV
jgi:hypothetical protein